MDGRRYLPLLLVIGALAGSFAIANAATFLAFGLRPHWLSHALEIDFARYDALGSRAAELEREVRRGEPLPPLGLIVSQSSALWGIDLAALEQLDGLDLRWYLNAGNGRSAAKMAYCAEPVLAAGADFEVAVLAIHLVFFAGDPFPPRSSAAELRALADDLGAGRFYLAAERLLMWPWFVAHRQRLGAWCVQHLLGLRRSLAHALWQPSNVGFAPAADPFFDPVPPEVFEPLPEPGPPTRNPFWSRPEAYDEGSVDVQALRQLAATLAARGTQVVILLMPERSVLRETTPATAWEAVIAPLGLPVIDLRDLVADDLFFDRTHVGAEGRVLLTRALADQLQEVTWKR
jgi:hypothetical protein